ncbi:MAG: RNA polymerase sigma factor [Acidobacteriota bacterium]
MAGSDPAQNVRLSKEKQAEERRLVEAAQREPACFIELYETHFNLVYAYVARRVRHRAETEDLTADVFRRALQSLPRFKWTGGPFAAWLFRIASNLIADRAKRHAKEEPASPGDALPSTPQLQTHGEQQTDLEECERRAKLFTLVDELPDDQRRVVVMRFAEEKSIGEIAGELGRSEGAVKQLQFRALENLRKKIQN